MACFKAYSPHVLNSHRNRATKKKGRERKQEFGLQKNPPCILHTNTYNPVIEFMFST